MMHSSLLSVAIFVLGVWPSFAFAWQEEPTVGGYKKSEWLKMMEDTSARKRRAAVVALGIIGPDHKEVVPALGRALRDKEQVVRTEAIQILSGMERDKIRDLVPEFADALKDDPSPAVRQQAAQLLGRVGALAKPALNSLIRALKDKETTVRAASADAIGRIGPEAREASTALVPLLQDKEMTIRLAAIFSLGRIGLENEAQLESMTKTLQTDDALEVRKEAARSIGLLELSAKSALPALMKTLREDKSAEVRQQTALSIGKMGADVGLHKDALLGILKADKDKTVRLYVMRSLSAAMGDNLAILIPDLCKILMQDPDGEIRLSVVQELGNLGEAGKAALPSLRVAEQDVQIAVREAAKQASKKINEAVAKAAAAPKEKPATPMPEDANAPTQDLRAEGDANKRYFLIGPKPDDKPESFGLLIVLPGGAGDENFHPFVKTIFKESVPAHFLVVQLVAPKWDQNQEIVWPTEKLPVKEMKFTTEAFIEAAIADVEKKHKIDPKKIYTLSWSSGGPAAYAASLSSKKIIGSFIAMSVFKPDLLPNLDNAKDRKYYLLHSPDDAICRYRMAEQAETDLAKNGAKVKLVKYAGPHGWPANTHALIQEGMKWLEETK